MLLSLPKSIKSKLKTKIFERLLPRKRTSAKLGIDQQTEFQVLELIRKLRDNLNDNETESHILLQKAVDFFLNLLSGA